MQLFIAGKQRAPHLIGLGVITFITISSLLTITSPPSGALDQLSSGLSIAPLREEVQIDPGFAHSGTLLLKNSSNAAQHIELSAQTFATTNQAYDYTFQANTPEANWVTFDHQTMTLAADDPTTVTYQVNVPLGTEPGGYYLALFALTQPQAVAGGITPSERVASLIYITVSGTASHSGQLLSLASPAVVFGPASWSATIQNSGSLHYRSTYQATLTSVFDHQLAHYEDSRLILPQTVRLIESSLPLPEFLGIYKVHYTVSLGDNPAHSETRWFVYLPPLQILLLAAIVASTITLHKTRRSKNA